MTRSLCLVLIVCSSGLLARQPAPLLADSQTVFKPCLRTLAVEAQTLLLLVHAVDGLLDVDLVDTRGAKFSRFGLRLM
jgi:hypothetical protein